MSTPKIRNSHGNWWYSGAICEHDGCNNPLDDPTHHEYVNRDNHRRVNVCKEHYRKLLAERHVKSNPRRPRHPDTNQLQVNWITARAVHYYGGNPKDRKNDPRWKECRERATKDAKAIDWVIQSSAITSSITEHSNVVAFPKEDFGPRTPMTRRKSTEVTGEKVNEGWVYIVRNPEVPQHLKIGKTFPNGIGDIMTSARRYGRAELLFKCEAAHAEHAEKKIAHVELSEYNLRNRGYADVGTEVFEVPLEKAIEVVRMACDIVNDPEWEGATGDANET